MAFNGGPQNFGYQPEGLGGMYEGMPYGAGSQQHTSGKHTSGKHTSGKSSGHKSGHKWKYGKYGGSKHTSGKFTSGHYTSGKHTSGSHTSGHHTSGKHTSGYNPGMGPVGGQMTSAPGEMGMLPGTGLPPSYPGAAGPQGGWVMNPGTSPQQGFTPNPTGWDPFPR